MDKVDKLRSSLEQDKRYQYKKAKRRGVKVCARHWKLYESAWIHKQNLTLNESLRWYYGPKIKDMIFQDNSFLALVLPKERT